MRIKFAVLLAVIGAAALLLGPNQGLTQPGRGFPGGGSSGGGIPGGGGGFPGGGSSGGRFDPMARFEQYARGRGFFYISEVTDDPSRQARLTQYAQQNSITDGKITAQHYQGYIQMFFGNRGSSGGSFPGGGSLGSALPGVASPSGGAPGGFSGGMTMMGGDPGEMFNRLSGGKDSIRRSDLSDPMMQMMFDRFASQMGVTNGEITRQQFTGAIQQFQAMRSGGGMPGSSGPGGQGNNPNAWNDSRFRQRDQNGDGLLNYDEMSDTLRVEREKWDANRDGFIDVNEYKAYSEARNQQREQERASQNANRGGSGSPDFMPISPLPEEEDRKPVVYRAGKLPKEIPQWFKDLDTDTDGQVGLYEWKTSGRSFDEFNGVDRNGDGFVTISETLFFLNKQKENASRPPDAVVRRDGGSNTTPGSGGTGSPPSFGGRGPGSGSSPGGFPSFGGRGPGSTSGSPPSFGGRGPGGNSSGSSGGSDSRPPFGGFGGRR